MRCKGNNLHCVQLEEIGKWNKGSVCPGWRSRNDGERVQCIQELLVYYCVEKGASDSTVRQCFLLSEIVKSSVRKVKLSATLGDSDLHCLADSTELCLQTVKTLSLRTV